jgi:hypothetical protein
MGSLDIGEGRYEAMATGEQGGAQQGGTFVDKVTSVSDLIGTLVPTVGAIGVLVRLIASAVRPSDAQQAQAFDAAIAELDAKIVGLNSAIGGFEAAKAQAPSQADPTK